MDTQNKHGLRGKQFEMYFNNGYTTSNTVKLIHHCSIRLWYKILIIDFYFLHSIYR